MKKVFVHKWFNFWKRFPIKINFLFIILALLLSYRYLFLTDLSQTDNEAKHFLQVIILVGQLIWFFVLSFVLFSLISTAVVAIIYQYGKSKRFAQSFRIENTTDHKTTFINNAPHYLYPILGFLKGRLWFRNETTTPTFLIGKHSKNTTITLRDIKEYDVENIEIIFQDMLRMLQIPIAQHKNYLFSNPPNSFQKKPFKIQSWKHNVDENRTNNIIHAPGEWLQYKTFEPGDDVRRIMWKIYAKNKELVIRSQEMHSVYADKLIIVPLFDADFPSFLPDSLKAHFLNHLKNVSYSIYKDVANKGWHALLQIADSCRFDNDNAVKKALTKANWQNTHKSTISFPKGAIIIAHSLLPNEVFQHINNLPKDKYSIIYLKFTDTIEFESATNFIKRLFLKPTYSDFQDIPVVQRKLLLSFLSEKEMKYFNS